jgi:hypothetical protein
MDVVQSMRRQTETTPSPLAYRETRVRVYFHLKYGSETIIDREGVEVSDLEEARVQASAAIEELRQEDWLAAQSWSRWRLEASDEGGQLQFSLDLAD